MCRKAFFFPPCIFSVEGGINSHNLDCMIYADETQLYMQPGEDRATPLESLKQAPFLSHGRKPEVNISHATTVISPRSSN